MNEIATQLSFDYAAIDQTVAIEARAAAERIRIRMRRTAEDIVEIGRELVAMKALLPHGRFLPWIDAEFEMGTTSAQRFMQAFERFGKSTNLVNLRPSVVYLLSAPSTPEPVVAAATEKAASGDKVTIEDVKRLRAEYEAKIAKIESQAEADLTEINNAAVETANELAELKARPPAIREVVREVAPPDYEATKSALDEAHAALKQTKEKLAALKQKQQEAIKSGVSEQIRFRKDEVEKLESKREAMQRNIEELDAALKSRSREVWLLNNKETRGNVEYQLVQLAAWLADYDHAPDHQDDKEWLTLAAHMEAGAAVIRKLFGGK
jgi:hypothetical protein